MKTLKVRIKFTEEVLGSASNDPKIHERFIASKAEDEDKIKEEMEALGAEEEIEITKTIFPKLDDGTPFIYDYQIKGFFKDTCGVLRTITGTESSKIKAYKKFIDGRIFPEPRRIPIFFADNGQYEDGSFIGSCQRPLRASTPMGERNSLANSECIKAGATCEFEILLMSDDDEKWVKEMLEYGRLRGLGQWRNSGKGRFETEYID